LAVVEEAPTGGRLCHKAWIILPAVCTLDQEGKDHQRHRDDGRVDDISTLHLTTTTTSQQLNPWQDHMSSTKFLNKEMAQALVIWL
jgi:hypothetical protein